LHKETKEYWVYLSLTENGEYTKVATVPEIITYLEAPSKISASETTIYVDSTSGFPNTGIIEISGLSSEKPAELVSYTGKTANSFTGCTRGALGTTPAEHWNDAFVWKYTGHHGYMGSFVDSAWYKVKSVEWSGLSSDLSEAVKALQAFLTRNP